MKLRSLVCLIVIYATPVCAGYSQIEKPSHVSSATDEEIEDWMDDGDIPGLSLIFVKGRERTIRCYGYANIKDEVKITPQTIFEIGSCSKAFTAVAIAQLALAGRLHLTDTTSKYLPWLTMSFKGKDVPVTISQLLHHTSGIPWNTISGIPQSDSENALDETVRTLIGIELNNKPGEEYEYATINYDVLALIIQVVTGENFEQYLQNQVIDKLGLTSTTSGEPQLADRKASGYKIGFFRPLKYESPPYRGNIAAGYVMSDAVDIATWMQLQMLRVTTTLKPEIQLTQQRDETVAPHGNMSYAMGWEVSLKGDGTLTHSGLNPSFSAFVIMQPASGTGVAVLANSNSGFTPYIAQRVFDRLMEKESVFERDPARGYDKFFSIASFMLLGYLLIALSYLAYLLNSIFKLRRRFDRNSPNRLYKIATLAVILSPFICGIYIAPSALAGFSWESARVWLPLSFDFAILLTLAAIGVTCTNYLIGSLFPDKDKFKDAVPSIVLISVLAGLANMASIITITSSINSAVETKYLVFYFVLILAVYLGGRKFVQTRLILFTKDLAHDLRIRILNRVMSNSYQRFESIDRGRVYTAMNNDVSIVGESANMFVALVSSLIMAIAAFLYLGTIAFWATLITIGFVCAIATLYHMVSKGNRRLYERARDSQNVFMRLLNGLIDGYKEINISMGKKIEYKNDLLDSSEIYKTSTCVASIRFVNAFLIGESLLIGLMGVVAFAFPTLFPGLEMYTIMSFIVVLLYLVGPVNGILSAVPNVMQVRIAWTRIQSLISDLPENIELKTLAKINFIDSIRAVGTKFQYQRDGETFTVGPVDLEARKGEILFIIGGNGSGKTTLAKMLTGLYQPVEGQIYINDVVVDPFQLGEHYTAVFTPPYIFNRIYNVDPDRTRTLAPDHLTRLGLSDKVTIEDNQYSTVELSGGQRKRLALLQCYLEDAPVLLFDEWAADQDPEYRAFFYNTILPDLKKVGKIVIAITHDNQYFSVADKILKMNAGKVENYKIHINTPTYETQTNPL